MRIASPRSSSLALILLLAPLVAACGDDSAGDTGVATGPVASTGAGSSTTADTSEGSTSTGAPEDSTGSTAAPTSDADSTTGSASDPTYPPPNAGVCPDGTVPVLLPGAELCAPFCAGETDPCPEAASGDAATRCTPFAGQGGSGDACDELTPCPAGETCSAEGSCSDVAFHACQLFCDMGQTCPEGMACSGIGTCGYP